MTPLPAAGPPGRGRGRALRTTALYAVTLWAVVSLVFLLPRLLPGDPLRALDDPGSGSFVYDDQVRAKVAAYYGLDRPLTDQYVSYLGELGRGDLGWSISQSTPVSSLLRQRLPWTLLLSGSALAISAALGFAAGLTAAWHRGRVIDRALLALFSTTRAVPEYAIASALLVLFAVTVPLFPQAGAQTPFAEYSSPVQAVGDVLAHLVLPLTALTLSLMASKFLLVRYAAVSTLGEDYMLLARAKGLSRRTQKYRHCGRNTLLPFVTALGAQTGFAVGASLFVEAVFAYPGVGSLVQQAVTSRDYPLLQGVFLLLAAVVLLANLAVELASARLDPRVVRR